MKRLLRQPILTAEEITGDPVARTALRQFAPREIGSNLRPRYHPARELESRIAPVKATVVLAGEMVAGPRIRSALGDANVVIAADGGAASLERVGFVPNVLIGDLDSISEAGLSEVRGAIPEILQFPTQKDETDADLALGEAVARGATEITVLGAFGGPRIDHELANVLLLAGPSLRGREVRLLTESFEAWGVSNAARMFAAEIGDTVSLIPVTSIVTDVTTEGLEWKLDRATLTLGSTQAISNVAAASRVSVSVGNGTVILLHHFGSEA